jgi:DNA-binding NtrC family response regulator
MGDAAMNGNSHEEETPRILVVDDEESIRYMLSNFLIKKGCDVTTAGSGEEALELWPDACPDVALIDIVLPGKDGIALLSDVKQRSPDTEVVLITCHGSVETAVESIRRGAYDYLQKPFAKLERVWLTVERALEKRRLSLQVRGCVGAETCRARGACRVFERMESGGAPKEAEAEPSTEDIVTVTATRPDRT